MKILPLERVEDFLNGSLFMNTDRYFTEIEITDSVRYDSDEDADEILQIKKVEVKDKEGKWVTVSGEGQALYRMGEKNKEKVNIFCMYALTDVDNSSFDQRNLDFGEAVVAITNAVDFINRIKSAAIREGRRAYHGPVEYVDRNSYHGPLGPFRKLNYFAYQNEFRFVLKDGDGNPTKLEIGDIRDIARVYKSLEIQKIYDAKKKK